MSKYKYMAEYELKASPKMLFPYLTSPAGLTDWFAEKVTIDDRKVFHFVWDGVNHSAVLSNQRLNRYVKFDFLSENGDGDHAYIEFKLDMNELTQSTFLKVIDYSEMDDEEDLRELWDHLVVKLRELVGG